MKRTECIYTEQNNPGLRHGGGRSELHVYGTIIRKDGNEVELKNCRRIWYWNGAASLSELALSGVRREGSKFSVTVESITILGVIEIIPCTEKAIKSIDSVPV